MKRTPTLWSIGALASLLTLFATGAWAELDALGPAAWAFGATLYAAAWFGLARANAPTFDLHPLARPGVAEIALVAPLVATVWLGWRDEFPFGGDHDHHLLAIAAARDFWREHAGVAALGVIAIALGARFAGPAPWPVAAFGLFVAASFSARIPAAYFARYPATYYTMAAAVSAATSRWLAEYDAARLVNVAAPLFYLGLLRPAMFGRRAGLGWVVPTLFLVAQPDVLRFVDSDYLEPWPLMLLLLALEALFDEGSHPALAALIAGLATGFKETATLPFLAIGAGALWRARRARPDVLAVLAGGTLGVIPFLIYYLVRREEGVWRTLGFADAADVFTPERLAILRFRLVEQSGFAGLFVLALLVAGSCVVAARRRSVPAALLVAGALAQAPLFFADRISLPWPGYPRFYFMAWIMALAPAHLLGPRAARVAVALLAVALAPKLIAFLASFAGPSYSRNFTEDYAAPIRTPVRELVTRAGADLREGQVVRWIHGCPFEHDVAFARIFPDLHARFAWEAARAPTADHQCRCAPGVALLVSTPRSRNLHQRSPAAPYPAELDRTTPACRDEIERTCRCIDAGDPAEARLCVAQ